MDETVNRELSTKELANNAAHVIKKALDDTTLEHILEVYKKVEEATKGNSDQFPIVFDQVMRVLYPSN
jgi:hypothetical protein